MATRTRLVHFDVYHVKVDELFRTQEARDFVEDASRKLAQNAAELAPQGKTGETAASYRTFATEVVDGIATGHWGSDSSVWHIIEFGSRNNAPYRVMRRACEVGKVKLRFGGKSR